MKEIMGRRSFFKYLLSIGVFGVTSLLSFKKDEGFLIGRVKNFQIGTPEATGSCSYGSDCAGGGGQCSYGASCGGGGGHCSYGSDCAGGGGQCSYGSSCAGS